MAGEILTEQFEVNANFCDLSQTVLFLNLGNHLSLRGRGVRTLVRPDISSNHQKV